MIENTTRLGVSTRHRGTCAALIAALSNHDPTRRFMVAARRICYVHGRVSGHDHAAGERRAELNRHRIASSEASLDLCIGLASILDFNNQFWTVICISGKELPPSLGWTDPVFVPDLFLRGSPKHPSLGAWPEHFDLRAFLTEGASTDRAAVRLALDRAMNRQGKIASARVM